MREALVTGAKLDHLTKYYGDTLAVDDVNLDVTAGDFVVLVGPSGCGKTTTLRMVAGLERVTEGEVWIGGERATDVAPKDRDIAMVFQSYALYPHFSVRKNLAYNLRLQSRPNDEIAQRVEKVARTLGIEELLHRKPAQLSGGQRQRVALGRAIIRQPKLFLMDEPLSNLDANLRVQTRAEIVQLQQRLGITTIYVTHDQTEAMTMGSTIVVMRDGRVQQVASPQDVYQHPANAFVARFIGSPPMNLLRCRIVHDDTAYWLEAENQTRLRMPDGIAHHLPRSAESNEILFGCRPEDLNVAGDHHQGDAFRGSVEVIEALGHETLLYVSITGLTDPSIITRMEAGAAVRYQAGDPIALVPDWDQARFFSIRTEEALPIEVAPGSEPAAARSVRR
jgi:multiple sugar transport system ATP-binding protein